MIGIDTSFLVALAIREHPSHAGCRRLFTEEIQGGEATMAVAAQALAEFCHVVTDPRRFERPLEMFDALDLSEQWWGARECRPVTVDTEVGALFFNWMDQFAPGRKRLLDTLLAATYYRAGVTRLATTDWRDFETYGVLELERL